MMGMQQIWFKGYICDEFDSDRDIIMKRIPWNLS